MKWVAVMFLCVFAIIVVIGACMFGYYVYIISGNENIDDL